jgi:hypothetical protein
MSGPTSLRDIDIAVDAHVHLHDPEFDIQALECAAHNFATYAPVGSAIGAMMLAETHDQDGFARLSSRAFASGSALAATAEPCSLWFSSGAWRVLIVAGRQIVTAEGLEVLALATCARFPDGLPLEAVLQSLAAEGAIAVLPWGCGKWLGARARLVRNVLAGARAADVFVGDNSGRPAIWREPLFKFAGRRGVRILPGSDPLPIRNEWRRIGCFGVVADVSLSVDTPAADLRRALSDPRCSLRPYGELESIGRFVTNQALLRLPRARTRGRGDTPSR